MTERNVNPIEPSFTRREQEEDELSGLEEPSLSDSHIENDLSGGEWVEPIFNEGYFPLGVLYELEDEISYEKELAFPEEQKKVLLPLKNKYDDDYSFVEVESIGQPSHTVRVKPLFPFCHSLVTQSIKFSSQIRYSNGDVIEVDSQYMEDQDLHHFNLNLPDESRVEVQPNHVYDETKYIPQSESFETDGQSISYTDYPDMYGIANTIWNHYTSSPVSIR